jgi:hypothetical protein
MVYYEPRMGDYPGAKYDTQQLTDRSTLGVNVATGNLLVSNTDVNLAGVNGLNLSIGRYYNNYSSDQWAGSPPRGSRNRLAKRQSSPHASRLPRLSNTSSEGVAAWHSAAPRRMRARSRFG